MRSQWLFGCFLIVIAARPAAGEYKPSPKLEEHLATEFPTKVIGPAIGVALTRVFRDDDDARGQAREAFQAALASQLGEALKILGDFAEALQNRDRAAAEAASKKLDALMSSRTGYWEKVIGKILPDVGNRLRPLVRVGLTRHYRCDTRFIGRALGLDKDPKEASRQARQMKRFERIALCQFVRRWAESKAVAQVDKLVEDIGKSLKGEQVELTKQAERTAYQIRRVLERDLVMFVGEYKEKMDRIREALDRLTEALPRPSETPAPQAPPAP